MKKIALILALVCLTAATLLSKQITIDTPYLLGDQVVIVDTFIDRDLRSGTITGICIDEDTVFYRVETKETVYYLSLEEVQKMQPSVEAKG